MSKDKKIHFDSSRLGFAEQGIKLSREQAEELGSLNILLAGALKEENYGEVLYLLIMALRTMNLTEKVDDESLDVIRKESNEKRDYKFESRFGKYDYI